MLVIHTSHTGAGLDMSVYWSDENIRTSDWLSKVNEKKTMKFVPNVRVPNWLVFISL